MPSIEIGGVEKNFFLITNYLSKNRKLKIRSHYSNQKLFSEQNGGINDSDISNFENGNSQFLDRGVFDPNFENAVQTILSWSNTAQPSKKVQALQLVLSLPVPKYHTHAKLLLDEARLATKKTKSAKSIKNRLRKERLRKERMMKKKKK